MRKVGKKVWLILLLAFLMVFGSSGYAMAAEQSSVVSTESMEIRTEGKVGLRTISAVDRAHVEQLKKEGKTVTYGTVAVPATVLEAVKGELKIGGSYTYKNKVYKALDIPAERNWEITKDKIYFTGVLTGISGAGFNTRYAVRSYIKVDGKVTYGNVLKQSSYAAAQEMTRSEKVATSQKSWVAKNVIDACDDAKKVTEGTLTITSADLQNGSHTVKDTPQVRNYKKVIVDSSVKNGKIILENIRVRELQVATDASCTITANNVSFDKISKGAAVSRATGNLVLNLGTGSNVTELSASSNMTVTGNLKIAKVTVAEKVSGFEMNVPAEKLTVAENAAGSIIVVNEEVEDAVLSGNGSTISGKGKIDKVEDKGNNTVEVEVLSNSIVSVEVHNMNSMTVTLERATKKPLTKDAMAILCDGGNDMTIINATTTDNRVYKVSTSTFTRDDVYTFSIQLESGKIIQKEFDYKVNCPTASKATVLRSEETRAEFDLFDVDEGGHVYVYIPGHTQVGKTVEVPSVETVKKGYKQQIQTGFNKVILKGLDKGISYKLYYVLEAYDGRSSNVLGPLSISGNVQEDPNLSKEYEILSVEESPKNTITIKLNKAPKEELTLNNFSFICPSDSAITIDKAELKVSTDRTTYTIVIPENYQHKDNQYTAKITFSNGTVAKKTFRVEYKPPTIRAQKVERVSETRVRYTFTSDESGWLYYGTYKFNGAYNWENNTPKAIDIFSGKIPSVKVPMHGGTNTIEFDFNGTDKDVFALHVDEKGNYREGYAEHEKIPGYVPPVVPEEPKVAIESIIYNKEDTDRYNGTCLDITFSQDLDWYPREKDIRFEVIKDGKLPAKVSLTTEFINNDPSKISVQFNYYKLQKGTYKIYIDVNLNGEKHTVEKEFTIN